VSESSRGRLSLLRSRFRYLAVCVRDSKPSRLSCLMPIRPLIKHLLRY